MKPIFNNLLIKGTQGNQGDIHGGGALLNDFDGGSDTKVFTRAVQQLKTLPRANTKSHFWHTIADTIPHFDSPKEDK